MLVFSEQNLAFIAVPKTGTTALEMALKPWADITFTKQRKHMTAQRFHRRVAPFLDTQLNLRPERFAVIRDPEEQVRSWYRYRTREALEGDKSSFGMSFDEFVADVIKDRPPAHAGIGSQYRMLTGRDRVLVHHLFAYEAQTKLRSFVNERFGEEIVIKPRNVSPPVDAPLSSEMRERLRASRAKEYELYDRVMTADGHLVTEILRRRRRRG
ncbi:MAG: hypothetical protein AB3N23_11550 [Paracoccaceae bacterium]